MSNPQPASPRFLVVNPLAPNVLPSRSAGPVLVTHHTAEQQMASWYAQQAARGAAGGAYQAQASQAPPTSPPRSAAMVRSTVPLPPLEPVLATQVPPDQLFGQWAAMYREYEAQALAPRPKRARYGADPCASPDALASFSTGHILPPHLPASPLSPPHAQSLELQKAYVEREKEDRVKLAMGARD
ncbi:hypothetical protein JCM8208_002271 [Rhodotorula glutinis]